jgi:hypothetical protein
MQSFSTIYHENNPIIIKYNEMSYVHYNYWTKLYDNQPIEFNITDTIKLNSDSKNVIITINNTSMNNFIIFTIPLEECQQAFHKYYIKLSHSNLQELLKNSYC